MDSKNTIRARPTFKEAVMKVTGGDPEQIKELCGVIAALARAVENADLSAIHARAEEAEAKRIMDAMNVTPEDR